MAGIMLSRHLFCIKLPQCMNASSSSFTLADAAVASSGTYHCYSVQYSFPVYRILAYTIGQLCTGHLRSNNHPSAEILLEDKQTFILHSSQPHLLKHSNTVFPVSNRPVPNFTHTFSIIYLCFAWIPEMLVK